MIEVKTDQGNDTRVVLKGNIKDLTAETSVILKAIYNSVQEEHPFFATYFKLSLQSIVLDDSGPIWRVEEECGGQMQ